MKVGQEAFDFVPRKGRTSRMVVSDSEICRWQLEHGTGKPGTPRGRDAGGGVWTV